MTSYQERSEINRRLADQAYFDAKLKRVEPQKKDVRIGGMDGQTGRYQVFHADGGFSNNGVRAFDGTPPSDRFVRGQQNPNSNAIALGYRDYVKTEFLNRIEEEEITTQIIFLFQKENKLYVGGDRDEPELIYEAEEGESISTSYVTKYGELINEYQAMFVSTKEGENFKIYINTILGGDLTTEEFNTDIGGDLAANLSFIARNGSFIGQGFTAQITEGEIPPFVDVPEIERQAILDWRSETDGGVWCLSGGETLPIRPIPLTAEIRGYLYVPIDMTGIAFGSFQVFYLVDCVDKQPPFEIIATKTALTFIDRFEAIPSGEPCSLFTRPEDGLIRALEKGSYDNPSLLKTYYTNTQFTTSDDNSQTINFNSENILFFGDDDKLYIKRSDDQKQEIQTEEDLSEINNFIGNIIYQVVVLDDENEIIEDPAPIEIEENGVINVITIDVSRPSSPVISTPTPIEYIGIPEDLKAHIVNYSVFF